MTSSRAEDRGELPPPVSTREVMEEIDARIQAAWHQSSVRDILINGAREETEDPGYRGHNMQIRRESAGCRLITMNVNKKLMTTVDRVETEQGTQHVRYIDHVLDYMEEQQGDIVIINEPGAVHAAPETITRPARNAEIEALVLGSEHSKAAGLVILMSKNPRFI